MNVILLQDVDKLGSMGAEVKVEDGYARNYLIPRKMALLATAEALKLLEKKKKERAIAEQKLKAECAELAKKIVKLSLTVQMESGEEEKLFGSVTSDIISEALKSEGMEVDKKKIVIKEPIKKLGVYTVGIKLHSEVETEVRVWVVKK
ncbi:MAG: 50S ribosomal protein L9 [Candidatus Omnitrophica bacterium]|nr:50S ribosomal protein L9 [Candidatus Omnitrophota bacterium]